MTGEIEALLSPADYQTLRAPGLAGATCVVFDVLRATSVMVTALANGAAGIVPVAEIATALEWKQRDAAVLLAGERDGLRIRAAQTGGVEFDLGNSPREYTPARVAGKRIVATTTNGTRALRACAAAPTVLVGSFLNLAATAQWLAQAAPERIVLVCAGTAEFTALEDVLAAGALCDCLGSWPRSDAAEIAWRTYRDAQADLVVAVGRSRNGRRLLANPELREDVAFCLQRDTHPLVATLDADGVVRALPRG
jgi:2-phosphosulfolactate phosphatase